MEIEQVEVLNSQFEVIKVVSKVSAHEQGFLHRCVVAELIDSQGNWTLVKQAADKQDAGQWVSPVGGHGSAGESVERALAREAEEELGIAVKSYQFIGQTVLNRRVIGRHENHLFCVYEIHSDDQPTLNHESVSWQQFSQLELRQALDTTPQKFGAAFHWVIKSLYPQLGSGVKSIKIPTNKSNSI